MDYQKYCFFLERTFLKGEYISIAKTGAKMLTTPNMPIEENYRVFCFVTTAQPNMELCKKFAKYAMSVKFYDDGTRGRTPIVIPLFVAQNFDSAALSGITKKAQKHEGAVLLPCAFSLEEQTLTYPETLPILAPSAFKEALAFAKKALRP